MATITKRTNKDGSVVYRIRVSGGRKADGSQLNAYQTTWHPDPNKSERANEKALNAFAVQFENDCKAGAVTHERRKFGEYGRYIVEYKYKHGQLKNSTYDSDIWAFEHLTDLDGIFIEKITPQMLTALYDTLLSAPVKGCQRYTLKRKTDPLKLTDSSSKSEFSRRFGVAASTLNAVLNGDNVTEQTAEKIAAAIGKPLSALFNAETAEKTLSSASVIRVHALVSMVLGEAVKDGLISSNPAERARLPHIEKKGADFLEPEQIAAVLAAADEETLMKRLFVYLLAASGGRRGEVLGLRWSDINFTFNQIHFEQTILYRKNIGIYYDTPKNKTSDRFLKLPPEVMEMIKEYQAEQKRYIEDCGSLYPQKITIKNGDGKDQIIDNDYLFTQNKNIGYPLYPDTVNRWLRSIADKCGIDRLHPHMFRHSAASALIYAGVDVVSVAGYLGHSSPVTTQNIYSHALQEAQNRNAEIIGSVMFKKKPLPNEESMEHKQAI